MKLLFNTAEPLCATTSHKWQSIKPKLQNFPSQSLTVGTSSKWPPPVSNCDHFLGLMVNDFPLFLTSCKRPLHAFSGLYFPCVYDVGGDIGAYSTVVLSLFSNGISVILILKCGIGAGAGLRYHSALWYIYCSFLSFWLTVFSKKRSLTVLLYCSLHYPF